MNQKSSQPADSQVVTVASLRALAAYVAQWLHETRPTVESSTAFVAGWTNASSCLAGYEQHGSSTALYKACQHLWGVNPPSEVEVYGNAPFSYRLRSSGIATTDSKPVIPSGSQVDRNLGKVGHEPLQPALVRNPKQELRRRYAQAIYDRVERAVKDGQAIDFTLDWIEQDMTDWKNQTLQLIIQEGDK